MPFFQIQFVPLEQTVIPVTGGYSCITVLQMYCMYKDMMEVNP